MVFLPFGEKNPFADDLRRLPSGGWLFLLTSALFLQWLFFFKE